VTGADGTLELEGLPPEWNNVRVAAAGLAPYDGYVRLPPDERVERTIVLQAGGVVAGAVRSDDGTPIGGAVLTLRLERSAKPVLGLEARTDAGGAYRIEHAPLEKVQVVAVAPDGRQASAWLRVKEGEPVRWDAVLGPPRRIAGVVLYDDGAPVAQARVSCERAFPAAGDRPQFAGTDGGGSFAFEGVRSGRHEVAVWHPETAALLFAPPARTVAVEPAEAPLSIRIPRLDAPPEPAYVTGALVRADGAAAAGAWAKIRRSGQPSEHPVQAGADGAFRFGPMASGVYDLEFHLDGEPTLHRAGVAVDAGATRDLGAIRFATPGRIRIEVTDAEGRPVNRTYTAVASLDQRIYYTVENGDAGVALSETLTPGRYLVYDGGTGPIHEVAVVAGETTGVTLRREKPRKVVLRFSGADGSGADELRYTVHVPPHDWWIVRGTLHGEDALTTWLVDGTYRVVASDDRGRAAPAGFTFTVSDADEPSEVPKRPADR
jgi:hypothetical protein